MFDKIKDGDLITLKLASGEEVIAKFVGKEPTHIIIDKALVLMQAHKDSLLVHSSQLLNRTSHSTSLLIKSQL